MRDNLVEKAKKFIDLQGTRDEKQRQLEELQAEMFGNGSEETEQKARKFFSKVGNSDALSSKTGEIDELREDLRGLEETLETTREELQKLLVDVQLPLNETIDTEDDRVEFPYSEEIPLEVIDAIENVLEEDLSNEGVTIDIDAIRVESEDVDEAMDRVMDRIEELRSKANMMVDVEQYVDDIHSRDEKLAKALYVLFQSEVSLPKKEIEERIGVETGDLRGQLYYVLENDPYIVKSNQEFYLSDVCERVMEAYVDQYGPPEGLSSEVEA